jgi:hypothetical protein
MDEKWQLLTNEKWEIYGQTSTELIRQDKVSLDEVSINSEQNFPECLRLFASLSLQWINGRYDTEN